MTRKSNYIMVVLACCGMVGITLGICVNSAGVFFTPLADEMGVGRGDAAMTLTIYNIVLAVAGLFTPWMLQHLGFKRCAVLATVVQVASTVLLTSCRSIYPMYLLHAMRGLFSGLLSTITVTMIINHWFRKKTALVMSIVLGSSGLIGALTSPLITSVINAAGWKTGYLVTAVLILVMDLPSLVFPISIHPEEIGMTAFGDDPVSAVTGNAVSKTGSSAQIQGHPEKAGADSAGTISIPLFIMVLIYGFAVSYVTAFPQHFPGLASERGVAAAGAFMLSAGLIVNTSGKLLLGVLIEWLGMRRSVSIYAVLILAGIAVLLMSGNMFVLILGAACYGFCYSLPTLGSATMTREIFGENNYSRVYPKVALVLTASNAIGTSVTGYMYDAAGSYRSSLFLMAAMELTGLVLCQIALRKKAAA